MFEYKHEAYQCIARGKKKGVFKNCVHLDVGGGSDGPLDFNPYYPYCQVNMLMPYNENQFQDRCPEDCALFKDKRRQTIISALKGPFVWFGKLPESTQKWLLISLVVVGIALVTPQSLTKLLEIIKALK